MTFCDKLILRADSLICDEGSHILEKIIINDHNLCFLSEIMRYNHVQIEKDRQNAISHFKEQFGLDFSVVTPDKNNVSIIEGAVFKPFYISPHINYRPYKTNGHVHQGGWIVLIVDKEIILTGQYGGSSGKSASVGNMLLFGYYNILIQRSGWLGNISKNCRVRWGLPLSPTTSVKVLHFKSSIPSQMTKDDIWSIKVDVWDPILDRKYKQMTGWYKKHHYKSIEAKENCQEYKIPDEGLWGKASGCSSLVNKCISGSKKWHLTIKTIIEFPMSSSSDQEKNDINLSSSSESLLSSPRKGGENKKFISRKDLEELNEITFQQAIDEDDLEDILEKYGTLDLWIKNDKDDFSLLYYALNRTYGATVEAIEYFGEFLGREMSKTEDEMTKMFFADLL